MSFINIAIAHDATCEKGDEWVFHGLAANKEGLNDGGKQNDDEPLGCRCVIAITLVIAIIGIVVWICN